MVDTPGNGVDGRLIPIESISFFIERSPITAAGNVVLILFDGVSRRLFWMLFNQVIGSSTLLELLLLSLDVS